ncbi:uncharacterized protein A1O5_12929 [Cladophialophora psammophila CBS 110553]|uniref:Uncharacterized protein n=1 Tax=Cladophialophora psammophila CBS 110553 TaxID=1182543 RepID=W9VHA9_9EURO|nr:uncharacterized protein A1O5_12929 [Cladophialophora psammophila CBS 110553]EXJ54863.1 hypothetical protein A1O5_12929 [Cladophialophora psammophila CBS 110553]
MYRVVTHSKQARRLIPLQHSRLFSVYLARMADQDKSALDADKGSVGSQFKPEGSIGQMGEKVGGPLSSEGAVGKQFTPEGSVGGAAQSAAEQMQGDKKPIFDKDGAVGKQFKPEGAIGSVGEAVGGPFSSKGAIGKQFTDQGAVGGTIQENLGSGKK